MKCRGRTIRGCGPARGRNSRTHGLHISKHIHAHYTQAFPAARTQTINIRISIHTGGIVAAGNMMPSRLPDKCDFPVIAMFRYLLISADYGFAVIGAFRQLRLTENCDFPIKTTFRYFRSLRFSGNCDVPVLATSGFPVLVSFR